MEDFSVVEKLMRIFTMFKIFTMIYFKINYITIIVCILIVSLILSKYILKVNSVSLDKIPPYESFIRLT